MNSYTELGTLRTYGEEESPTTVYECGECGSAVASIPTHEQWHAVIDAAIHLVIRKSESERKD